MPLAGDRSVKLGNKETIHYLETNIQFTMFFIPYGPPCSHSLADDGVSQW